MITTVTGKNQITIPADLARELNIKAGTRMDWSKDEDGTLRLKPLPSRLTIAHTGDGVPIYGPAGIAWRMMTKV